MDLKNMKVNSFTFNAKYDWATEVSYHHLACVVSYKPAGMLVAKIIAQFRCIHC